MADEEKKAVEEPRAAAEDPKPKAKRKKAKSADGKGKKDGGMMTKVIATVFGAVVAPILVAVGINYFKNVTTPDKPVATQPEKPPPTEKPPKERIVHLVGPDLNKHFYTWHPLGKDGTGKKGDVDPEQFRYEENPPRIVFLQSTLLPGRAGVLTTTEEYDNYTLHLKYRWREKQWGGAVGYPRRGSIGIHNTGPDGAFQNNRFSEGILVFLGEGEEGSVTLGGAPGRIQCLCKVKDSAEGLGHAAVLTAGVLPLGAQGQAMGAGPLPFLLGMADPVVRTRGVRWNDIRREYDKNAKEVPVVTGEPENWDLRIYRRGFPWYASRGSAASFPAFGAGWHPGGDAKLNVLPAPPPDGYKPNQWTEILVECNQDAITVTVGSPRGNPPGKKVMELTDLKLGKRPLTKGRITLSVNGSEMEVHELTLTKQDEEAKQPPEKPEKEPRKGRP